MPRVWTARTPPPHDADPLDHLLFRQHQAISRRQALEHLSPKALRHRLASGRWQRPHRSIYVAQTEDLTTAQRRWIAVLATDGLLAGFSALELHGLTGYFRSFTQVLVASDRRVRSPGETQVRRTAQLDPRDTRAGGAPPCTMPARSLVDAAQWAHDDTEAIAVIAAGFQQRLGGGDNVHEVLGRMHGVRRRRLILDAADAARGGSKSIAEIDFLRLCRRNRLPVPTRQVVRLDTKGRKRYRDALFEEYGVHVEIDGSQHMEVRSWHRDMRQHNDITIAGGRLLRFSWWQIRHREAEVAAQLRGALAAGGWRP
ncbi:hypothetical protein GCM10010399_88770 [Dactylosporangium fulvum]|uniref:DUF559 domain-containing protein n=1 Tax=Dactylosporangium fulvum TaxID=53359 RepID=A0ABY5VU38_9ACTN|nr:hypothetical protein [Dactylosporangium fulvum]UWP80631.1 hypothetical protein Dfulv_36545 [Dactylosporangium fulvum]